MQRQHSSGSKWVAHLRSSCSGSCGGAHWVRSSTGQRVSMTGTSPSLRFQRSFLPWLSDSPHQSETIYLSRVQVCGQFASSHERGRAGA